MHPPLLLCDVQEMSKGNWSQSSNSHYKGHDEWQSGYSNNSRNNEWKDYQPGSSSSWNPGEQSGSWKDKGYASSRDKKGSEYSHDWYEPVRRDDNEDFHSKGKGGREPSQASSRGKASNSDNNAAEIQHEQFVVFDEVADADLPTYLDASLHKYLKTGRDDEPVQWKDVPKDVTVFDKMPTWQDCKCFLPPDRDRLPDGQRQRLSQLQLNRPCKHYRRCTCTNRNCANTHNE